MCSTLESKLDGCSSTLLPRTKKGFMLRPILRNKNLSSEVNVSKSVGSSAGSRFFCNFCKALSAFFTFLFACRHQKVLKTVHWHSKVTYTFKQQQLTRSSLYSRNLIRVACLASAASFIIFSIS